MNKKTIGILVCMLLIASAVLPVAGIMTIRNNKRVEGSLNSDKVIKQNIDDKVIINEKEKPTPQPITIDSYLSIPAAALVPASHYVEYQNNGDWLECDWGWFVAPIYLPQGAYIKMLKFYWDDKSTQMDATLYLQRHHWNGQTYKMSEVESYGSSGPGVSVEYSVDYPNIDNEYYSYYLLLLLGDSIHYDSVFIYYSYEIPFNSDNISENQQTQVSQDLITH